MTRRALNRSSLAPETMEVVEATSAIITQAAKAQLTLRKAKDPKKRQDATDRLAALSEEYAKLRPGQLTLMQYMEEVHDAVAPHMRR